MNRKYNFLKRTPRIRKVNSLFNWSFIEKIIGERDAQENQICEVMNGHITPYVSSKANNYESYINKIYLRTAMLIDDIVQEANAMVIELKLLMQKSSETLGVETLSEEAQRQAAHEAKNNEIRNKRKEEILKKIAVIKAESEMVDEALLHHMERSEGILNAHIYNYWRGVLKKSEVPIEAFPVIETREYSGRLRYKANKDRLIELIDKALIMGGGNYEEEFNEATY